MQTPLNDLLTADSGVTNTMDASLGRCLSHSTTEMPALWHLSTMFSCNEFHGTTTTVVPVSPTLAVHNAGIISAMLLPAPVPITTHNGLWPSPTASTACSCTSLNSTSSWPVNCRNICRLFTVLTFFQRLKSASVSSAIAAADRFLLPRRNYYNVDACC